MFPDVKFCQMSIAPVLHHNKKITLEIQVGMFVCKRVEFTVDQQKLVQITTMQSLQTRLARAITQ